MELVRKWFARVGAVVTTATLAVFVPAVAWASTSGAYDVAVEAARSRRRSGGFGLFGIAGLLCCLVVVAGIVLAVVLISRNRKKR
jgi:hypothetical protein